jgi:hypothetical protein
VNAPKPYPPASSHSSTLVWGASPKRRTWVGCGGLGQKSHSSVDTSSSTLALLIIPAQSPIPGGRAEFSASRQELTKRWTLQQAGALSSFHGVSLCGSRAGLATRRRRVAIRNRIRAIRLENPGNARNGASGSSFWKTQSESPTRNGSSPCKGHQSHADNRRARPSAPGFRPATRDGLHG